MITSKNNQQIKNIRRLAESGKTRRKEGLFVAEGERICSEIPKEILHEIYVSESFAAGAEDVFENACVVADDVFGSVSDTVTPQGVLALVRQPSFALEEVLASRNTLVILDEIRDPGNLGTIIRTSEAAGAAVVISSSSADIFNPKTVRATMGSIFRVPFYIAKEELAETCRMIKQAGVRIYGAALEASSELDKACFAEKRAFVIGNEANGISSAVLKECDERIRIPMKGKVESLNAAVSAAILLYH